ncbi:MAG: hypothetical protein ACTSRZ_20970 [Promethearchaeota archaeon]
MKQLTDDLWLDSDEYNLTLFRKSIVEKGKDKGKERFVPVGYFVNIKQVARRLVDDGVKEFINGDWEKLQKYYKQTYERFIKVIEK